MAIRSLLATVLCTSALAACAATAAIEPAGATCDQFSSSPSIEQSRSIEAGTDLMVVLCSNATTGYAWGDALIADASVLRIADRTFQAPAASSLPIVGAAGGEVLTIRGVSPGTTTVSLSYGQPWAGGDKGAWTYSLTVTVQ